MARMLRIQYEGALYHVINRGNYRRDVFGTIGAAQAFEQTLAETCLRYQWRLHAYVIMRNHFHFALETPQPNLVDGMHWLQGTFATRFNRFRGERGHLFQGRYQALLVEDAAALARVIHYIHLNPIRAKIVEPAACLSFRWGSLRRLRLQPRPSWLSVEALLSQMGITDSIAGWDKYAVYLANLAANATEQENQDFSRLSSGWAIGTQAWRRSLARDYRHLALAPGLETRELRELKEVRWREALDGLMAAAGKSIDDAASDSADAPWKIAIAARLRHHGVPYRWIGHELQLGAANTIRAHVFRFREHRTP